MTSPDQSKGGRSRDEVLAGEYVLGVLSFQDRRVVEERMRRDRQFAAIVSRWETNLSAFNDENEVAANPGRETFKQIEARLFGEPELSRSFSRGLWNSAVFWRSLTFASLVVAIGAIIFASGNAPSPKGQSQLIAELSSADSQVNLLASYDTQSGSLRLVPVAPAGGAEKKSLELWLVPGSGTYKSLGIFQSGDDGELVIPPDLRGKIAEGTTLAVSLEPFGGSTSGAPTGPVVASGTTHRR
ncbi:anti-sigma K factor RskA-like protein [Rhizobium etli 8C-3]|uniref:Anti-sigma K factor RskA-like protein n=1 Tax=Rhizobium etli 8C-3 TaxID=538025 RepID=A0A1L5NZH4_RHIET|nr:anti-sigma factor [Rhizobium etli]APO73313.1 anti-sigma K factor RskA-like protein [Rhizobium etli 8C-3]